MIADFLYNLVPKELLGAPVIERLMRRASLSTAASPVAVELFIVPDDQVLLILGWTQVSTAGAAQTVTNGTLLISDEAGNALWRKFDSFAARGIAAPTQFVITWDGPFLIASPGQHIRAEAAFSAAGAANVVEASLQGMLIPRGNLQFN